MREHTVVVRLASVSFLDTALELLQFCNVAFLVFCYYRVWFGGFRDLVSAEEDFSGQTCKVLAKGYIEVDSWEHYGCKEPEFLLLRYHCTD